MPRSVRRAYGMTTAGNPVSNLNAFELRHLTNHLEAAGRIQDLHRLLRLDFALGAPPNGCWSRLLRRDPAPQQRVNAWYDAKLAADQLDAYVVDVRHAWRLAEETSMAAIEAGGRSATLGTGLRCACIIESLTSVGSAMPVPLLAALVQYGIWSAQRALAQARRPGVDRQMEWADTHDTVNLLWRLSQLGHTELARQEARSLPDPVLRASALGATGGPAGEALYVAASIADPERRAHAVRLLAPYLDDGLGRPCRSALFVPRLSSLGGDSPLAGFRAWSAGPSWRHPVFAGPGVSPWWVGAAD